MSAPLHTRRLVLYSGAALAAGAVAIAAAACQGDSTQGSGGAASSASTGGATSSSTTSSASSSGSGGLDCPEVDVERPAMIPEGWLPWTCWSTHPACVFWIAPDAEHMPEPVQWEPCVGAPLDDGVECERMSMPWDTGPPNSALGDYPFVRTLADGTPVMAFSRLSRSEQNLSKQYSELVVAEPDGPVRYAIRQSRGEAGCFLVMTDFRQGAAISSVFGDPAPFSPDSYNRDALMLAITDQAGVAPTIPYFRPEAGKSSWWGGRDHVVRLSEAQLMTVHDHAMTWSEDLIPNSVPEGNNRNGVVIDQGGAVFFTVDAGGHEGILVWDRTHGVRSFVQHVGDTSQGSANLGTDGVDLVWTHGEGRAPGEFAYPVRSVMTAKFTTDPAALQPRRLRSDPNTGMGNDYHAFAVGCGFAARSGGNGGDLAITRLVDGQGWHLPRTDSWRWSLPIGLTCEHVYVRSFDGRPFISRLRLSTLGPGTPAD
jgi:hypothetical protein